MSHITTEFGDKVEIPEETVGWEDLMEAKTVYIERNRWIGERTYGTTYLDLSYMWAVLDGRRVRVQGVPFYGYCNPRPNQFRPWLYQQLKRHATRFLPGFFDNLSVLM